MPLVLGSVFLYPGRNDDMPETWPRSSVNFNTPDDRSSGNAKDHFPSFLLPFSGLHPLGWLELYVSLSTPEQRVSKTPPESPFPWSWGAFTRLPNYAHPVGHAWWWRHKLEMAKVQAKLQCVQCFLINWTPRTLVLFLEEYISYPLSYPGILNSVCRIPHTRK